MAIWSRYAPLPSHSLKTGLAQARRVGRLDIKSESQFGDDGYGIGTGFLIDGSVFEERFAGLPFFLTASHVIDEISNKADITILFEGMIEDKSTRITAKCHSILLGSPRDSLDYSLLLLDSWPGQIPDLLLAPRTPVIGSSVYVVGYPRGGGLAISLHDNEVVLDERSPYAVGGPTLSRCFYYRAPTEGGSTGGPVFNAKWELAGMHMGRGTSSNYGIVIDAIFSDIRTRLKQVEISEEVLSLMNNTSQKEEDDPDYFSVFISYSHADRVFANRLCNELQAKGIRTWLDVKQMRPGDDIYEEVQKGIQRWDKVLLCCSASSLSSWWVDSEIDRIFQKEREFFKTRKKKVLAVIPLMLDDFLLSEWTSGKAQEIKSRIAADFRGWEDQKKFDETFKLLLDALRADGGGREIPPEPKL